MPIIPFFALVGQTSSPKEVVERFQTFYKSHATLSVDVAVKSSMQPYNGTGKISVSRPGIRIDISAQGMGYLLVLDANNGIEALPGQKVYAEFGGSEDLGKVPFRLGETMADLNIDPLLTGSLTRETGWQSATRTATGDMLKAHATDQSGTIDMEADVDRDGQLVRMKMTRTRGKTAPQWIETTFTGYSYGALASTNFTMDPAPGWNAMGLRLASMPIQPEEQAPDREVVSPDGSRSTFHRMLRGRSVVALLDSEWAASPMGVEVLTNVEKQFKDAGITMLKMLDEPGQRAEGFWSDPTGDMLRGLNAQGSPTFFLFDDKAKLEQAFFAFSPREPEALYKDIAVRLKELKED